MLTIIFLLARRFQMRIVVAFAAGIAVGLVLCFSVFAAHLRGACGPIDGVPGLVLCKVP